MCVHVAEASVGPSIKYTAPESYDARHILLFVSKKTSIPETAFFLDQIICLFAIETDGTYVKNSTVHVVVYVVDGKTIELLPVKTPVDDPKCGYVVGQVIEPIMV
jgi:hypothetical protein